MSLSGFWDWLATHTGEIQRQHEVGWLSHEMARRFEDDFPDLVFEVQKRKDAPWRFCISADGDFAKFPAVELAVARAPKLHGWEIVAFRQRGVADVSVRLAQGDLKASTIRCTTRPHDGGGVHVTLWIPGLKERDRELAGAALVLLDNAVGEYDAVVKIRSLARRPLASIAPDGSFPLSRLPLVLDSIPDPRKLS
jgi:hypothetical protein